MSRRPPLLLAVPALLALAFLLLPLAGLLAKAPWASLGSLLGDPAVRQALRLSAECACIATALSLVLGVPLAWLLARTSFAGRRLVRTLVLLPLVLPPVVGGVGLLDAFGARGLLGPALGHLGVHLPFSTAGVVAAETFVAMPFLVVSVEGALLSAGVGLEEAAATLGATRWLTFRRVVLPLLGPSVGAGAALAFARALGEFGATITFAGNLPGTTQTTPTAVYLLLQDDPPAAVALSLLLVALSLLVLLALRDRWVRPALRW